MNCYSFSVQREALYTVRRSGDWLQSFFAVAERLMEDLEEKAFSQYPNAPRVRHRFVSDFITVVKKDGAGKLLLHVYYQHQ